MLHPLLVFADGYLLGPGCVPATSAGRRTCARCSSPIVAHLRAALPVTTLALHRLHAQVRYEGTVRRWWFHKCELRVDQPRLAGSPCRADATDPLRGNKHDDHCGNGTDRSTCRELGH